VTAGAGPSLAAGAAGRRDPTLRLQWHKIMTGALRHAWTSLAVVTTGPAASSLDVARALTDAIRYYRMLPAELMDASGVTRASVGAILERIASTDRGLLIVGLDSFLDNPMAIVVAQAAQASLLCVTLGQTETKAAAEALEIIRATTIGSVVLRPRSGK